MTQRTVEKALLCTGLMLLLLIGTGHAESKPQCAKGYVPCGIGCMPIGAECCTEDGGFCVAGERCVGDGCQACTGDECPRRGESETAPAEAATGAQAPVDCSADMVGVPGGEFFMGCNAEVDDQCYPQEKPGKQVDVPGFCIDRTEVTVTAYLACVKVGACRQPDRGGECNWGNPGRETHPVNCVDWQDAVTYCDWAGKRLPKEAEWEKAARGTDGRVYPWGNLFVGDRANTDRSGLGHTQAVGSDPAGVSPQGALDMAGNVWEWVADKVDEGRGLRGGSWSASPRVARTSYRDRFKPSSRLPTLGFRCAR